MLTLDESTLFYFFLSDELTSNKRKFSSGINEWAQSIPAHSKPGSKAKSRKSTSSTTTLPVADLDVVGRSSASSVLTKNITISQTAPIKVESNNSIIILDGGISDNDETVGRERDAALASPPKGKKRINSKVSEIFTYTELNAEY